MSVLDRAAGALVGLAAGDALGAGYEFSIPTIDEPIVMRGGGLGPWAPGEWTDDTQQAVAIAQVTATGSWDPHAIGRRLLDWHAAGPKDVGASTSAVLRAAGGQASRLAPAALDYFARHPHGAAGNGSLMRTAPVALSALGDDLAIRDRSVETSALTHGDPLAGEACTLWGIGIDRAIRQGRFDGIRDGIGLLEPAARAPWAERLRETAGGDPGRFTPNGYVVTALQAALAAIRHTPVPDVLPATHLQHALERAVRIGHDTDTVAAIAGQLLGARWGISAIPWRWRRILHGWPGLHADDLVRLAVLTARHGRDDAIGWPSASRLVPWGRQQETPVCVPAPSDDGLLLGNLAGLPDALDDDIDAVVSLCRVGRQDVPDDVEHVQVWLVDQRGANPNLDFVIEDTVDALRTLRGEGKRVFVHCVGGRSRTPTVAAAYLADRHGTPAPMVLHDLRRVLPAVAVNGDFRRYLDERTA